MFGPEYPKMKSLWKRSSEKPHPVLVGEFTDPIFEYLWDTVWVAHEKIDGTNIRIHWDGHRITFGGRTDRAQLPPMLLAHLQENYGTPEFEQVIETVFGDQPVTIYGEGYGAGIQKGGRYRPDPSFRAFDLLLGNTGRWLGPEDLAGVLKSLGIPDVPEVMTARLGALVEFVRQGAAQSYVAELESGDPLKTVHPEGLVARPEFPLIGPFGERVMVKLKLRDLAPHIS
jgi:hypothetical protein